jgi:hypothetical protein
VEQKAVKEAFTKAEEIIKPVWNTICHQNAAYAPHRIQGICGAMALRLELLESTEIKPTDI